MISFSELLKNCPINGFPFKDLLEECNFIKYAAYRTAAKLRYIQKALYLDKVRLKVISSIFERYQLRQNENTIRLNEKDVEGILSDIFFVAQKENNFQICEDFVLRIIIRFLFSIYCRKKPNGIQVLSLKVFLTVFCQSKPREKYLYLFDQMSNHNYRLTRKNLMILLCRITKITEFICEGLSFGSKLINGTVESCFEGKTEAYEIPEETFITWLMQDPQLLVWLSTLYRMQISESVIHDAKCAICKIYPIIGLKYQCLRCLSYNICQICFFTGKSNKNHKLKHPVQEYCFPVNSQQCAKAFLLTLKNKLYKKNSKLQYLPAVKSESLSIKTSEDSRLLDEMEISSRTLIDGSRVFLDNSHNEQIKDVILHLEKEFEKLMFMFENFFHNVTKLNSDEWLSQNQNSLKKYKVEIKSHLEKLKLYHNSLVLSKNFYGSNFFASTPLIKNGLKGSQHLGNVSPIAGHSNWNPGEGNDLIWDHYDMIACDWDLSEEKSHQKLGNNEFSLKYKEHENETKKNKKDENLTSLSTFLGNEVLQATSDSSWLVCKNEELERVRRFEDGDLVEENKKMLAEVQADLKKILQQFHELSITMPAEKDYNCGSAGDEKNDENAGLREADALLKDLMNGINKLTE